MLSPDLLFAKKNWTLNMPLLVAMYYSSFLLVPQPPINISQSREGAVNEENHTLTCTVTVVNGIQSDLVMISWTGGSSLSSSPRVTITDQTNVGLVYTKKVIFSPLLNGDGGQYTCSVTVNGFDEVDSSSSVMVNGKYTVWYGKICKLLITIVTVLTWYYKVYEFVDNKHMVYII